MSIQSLVLPLLVSTLGAEPERPFDLMVGDPAPALEVRSWVQGEPIESFEAGQIYVVEFWATWCGPCRRIIPHMSELQKEYGDRAQFVGVSVWERISESQPYSVPAFVEQMGEKMSYTVAADRTERTQEARAADAWMKAAGQGGIPTSFIVDGNGVVAWIGSPFLIDEPLAQIVAGEWDLALATRVHAELMVVEALIESTYAKVGAAMEKGDAASAVAAIDAAVAKDASVESRLAIEKVSILLERGDAKVGAAYAAQLVDGIFAEEPSHLNSIAWMLVSPEAKSHPDPELATRAAKRASELTGWEQPSVLDTYARALFVSGDVAGAVEYQSKACELTAGTPSAASYEATLAEYRKQLEGSGSGA